MTGPEAALAACRIVGDTAAMILWGAFAYLAFLVPGRLKHALGVRLAGPRSWAVVAVLVATAAMLPLEAAMIGKGWPDALDPAVLRAILFDTNIGWAWGARAAAALVLAAGLAAPARWAIPATATSSGLLLATLALSGHAALHEGPLGLAHRLNDVLHVLAGGAWLGALGPLLLILKRLDDPDLRPEAGLALRRFSRAGHGAVALVIASGLANMALVLGRWPVEGWSPYQVMLACKIALVSVMTALALINRYVLVARMKRWPHAAVRALRWGTVMEIALAIAVIGCVGVFGLFDPG